MQFNLRTVSSFKQIIKKIKAGIYYNISEFAENLNSMSNMSSCNTFFEIWEMYSFAKVLVVKLAYNRLNTWSVDPTNHLGLFVGLMS